MKPPVAKTVMIEAVVSCVLDSPAGEDGRSIIEETRPHGDRSAGEPSLHSRSKQADEIRLDNIVMTPCACTAPKG